MQKKKAFVQPWLNPPPTPNQQAKLDFVKRQVCQNIRAVAFRMGMNQRELADYLCTSQSCVSRLCRVQIEQISLNQLFRFLIILAPNFEFLIST
jgi:predicted XRE-type DNA-binding protein